MDHDGLRTLHVAESTLHNQTIPVNSKTPNVICIVLNNRYFAFTFPIDFAMVMSPQVASSLDGVSASRHKNEAQTQYSLHHPCLLGVPMVGLTKEPNREPMLMTQSRKQRSCHSRLHACGVSYVLA